jgi:23S rRNA (cytidine1920-2'-O)/16S rRNA (cytidine1409-2'-O)-methyltransferase
MNQDKKRLDLLLLEAGLASTRTKAQHLIISGSVLVEGKTELRTGAKFPPDVKIELAASEYAYASRGGLKLRAAMDYLQFHVEGERVLDVGQSTGGFTDVLLEAGAASVVGVDVGRGQLLERLRNDPRVHCIESTDIRSLKPGDLGGPFNRFVMDLSFISVTHVLQSVKALLADRAKGLVLVKPQFELAPDKIGKGGLVRQESFREGALEAVSSFASKSGFHEESRFVSPVFGGDGNQEFFLQLALPSKSNES